MTDAQDGAPLGSAEVPPTPRGKDVTAAENIVTVLLKEPQRLSETMAGRGSLVRPALMLLACALASHAVFGFALGMFGGLPVAAMDAAKMPLVALCSLLLCFPSLYVFACVAGTPLTLSQTFMLGCSCLAMVGLILVGLAPVAWLFAVSTASRGFVTVLTLLIWIVALMFAGRYVGKLRANALFRRQAGIKLWFFILMLVTLQMVTCMRPMLTRPGNGWWTPEKKFFLSHFASAFKQSK